MHSAPSCKLPAVSCFHFYSCAWPSRTNGCCLASCCHMQHLTQRLSQDMHASGSCKERDQTIPLLAAAWHALPQYRNNATVFGHCHHSTMGLQCCIIMLQHRPAKLCFQGSIYLTIQYKPISQDPLWNSGVLGSSRGKEDDVPDGAVPHVYFPMRKGCRVTMYNDAHQVHAKTLTHLMNVPIIGCGTNLSSCPCQ